MYRPDEELLLAAAYYYGHEGPTNNVAEARALVDCIAAKKKVDWGDAEEFIVTSDTKLNISCMHCRKDLEIWVKKFVFKPSRNS